MSGKSVKQSFYFYDVETSGFNPKSARVMQFAGQRTDMDLKPVGKPDNFLIKLTPDVLPDPDAILVTGITPQKTLADGVGEAEFLDYFSNRIATPNSIITGYNNIRFDDEFLRFIHWRNFYDAYEWHWKDGTSRWDLLDVVRMTRALRPKGISWPFASDGTPSNRLELLSNINKLKHDTAHDALSDVSAAIAIARLIKSRQPKLFDYLLNLRDKKKVEPLVTKGDPLVYSSGRYPSEYEKTTIAVMVTELPDRRGALMYDLRVEPKDYIDLTAAELAEKWQIRGKDAPYFPIKILSYNKSPALAPLSVLDDDSQKRLKLDMDLTNRHLASLKTAKGFATKLLAAWEIMQPKAQVQLVADEQRVDEQLYDGFVKSTDKTKMSVVRAADDSALSTMQLDFEDERLKLLLPLYKARNFPQTLSGEEQAWWEKYRTKRLVEGGENSRASRYFKRLVELSERPDLRGEQKYLLEELNLYAQSILPLSE